MLEMTRVVQGLTHYGSRSSPKVRGMQTVSPLEQQLHTHNNKSVFVASADATADRNSPSKSQQSVPPELASQSKKKRVFALRQTCSKASSSTTTDSTLPPPEPSVNQKAKPYC